MPVKTRSGTSVEQDDDEINEDPCRGSPRRKRSETMKCPRVRKKTPSCTCSTSSTSARSCAIPRYEKYIKVFKVVIIVCLFGFIVWYISDHNYNFFRNELHKLRGHINLMEDFVAKVADKKDDVDRQLQDISKSLPVIKEMANDLKDDIKKCGRGSGSWFTGKGGWTMKGAIRNEIEMYDADKTDKTDFALESSGGVIISTRGTKSFTSGPALSLFGIPLCSSNNHPSALIQPGVMPGQCWAFKGSKGAIVIKLIDKIYVTGVSLEHIPRSISPTGEINTAPKEFSIWGLRCRGDIEGFFFGQFKYNADGTHVQYFPVLHKSSRQFNLIEFKVHSNYGHSDYTCVYRLRVHGDLKRDRTPECPASCNK